MSAAPTEATPWLARPQWAGGRIRSSQIPGIVLPWIMTIGACGITTAYLYGYGLFRDPGKLISEPHYLVMTPFVLVSAGLLIWTLQRTLLIATSGRSTFELTTIPGVIGGELAGVVHLPRPLRDGQSIRVNLSCFVISWTHGGTRDYCSTFTLWEDDIESADGGMNRDAVPVRFAIPATTPATVDNQKDANGSTTVRWTLEALGEPGRFWRANYEVPVFRTAKSPPLTESVEPSFKVIGSALGAYLHGTAFDENAPARIERPPSSRIRTSPTADGLEVRLPIRTAFLVASLWVVATLPLWILPLIAQRWLPAIASEVTLERSLVAAVLLNFLPAFFLVIGEPRRITVSRSAITVDCGWPPLGMRRRLPMDQYDGIEASVQYFAALRKNGSILNRHFFLATTLESNAEARWLASVIERAVARPPAAK